MGMGVCALSGLLATACGSSSSVKPDAGSPEAGIVAFGGLCSESQDCQSRVCLRFTANAEDASGICSALCATGMGCGSTGGACLPVSVVDAGACFPTCSDSTQCSGGLPCIWNPTQDAGICQPLPAAFCSEIAHQGTCEACLGASCCDSLTTCEEDLACSQLQASCSGQPACANTLQMSGNAAAQALGTCAAASCAMACAPDAG
jgi:hypothetical protein